MDGMVGNLSLNAVKSGGGTSFPTAFPLELVKSSDFEESISSLNPFG
jgi:hypothetical protein